MLACTAHRCLVLIYTCTRVQSNPLTERKVHSRTCVWRREMRMYTNTCGSDKRAATSTDPPGRGLRICRLSPLIWGPDLRNPPPHQFAILVSFPSVTAGILQIRSRMNHRERWRKRCVRVNGVSFWCVEKAIVIWQWDTPKFHSEIWNKTPGTI